MNTQYVFADKRPMLDGFLTITPDHFVETFTVKVRSLGGVSAETLKTLIQRKYEVTDCEKTDQVCFVR